MPHVDVDNQTQLYYEDHGSGRPVVLIHGWPLSGRSWEAQVPALIDGGYRVVTYDRRGFGSSSQPWSGYDYDTFAADLDALLRHLDLTGAVLVGFSMGGGEVARFVGRYGTERVAGAVFASAVPPYLYKSDDNPDGGLDDATIEQFEGGVAGDRAAFLEQFTTDFMTADGDVKASDALLRYLRTVAEFASPKGTLDCIGAFGRTDFRDDLTRVTVPTLVVHGDSDGIVPFEVSGRRTHEAIANSRLVVIEGGPHGINASHAEEFNRALLDFLATLDGDDGPDTQDTAVSGAGVHRADRTDDVAPPTTAVAASADAPSTDAPPAVEEPPSPTRDSRTEQDQAASAATADSRATPGEDADQLPAAESAGAADPATAPEPVPVDQGEAALNASAPDTAESDQLGLGGLVWRQAGDEDDDVPARRPGQVADPNLGDVPVDQQPRHDA